MLKISKKLMYALEAVVDISYNSGVEPAQSREINHRQGIPQRYLEQVMQKLVRAGVLKGVRGPRGGYRLARERRRITVGEVARVVNKIPDSEKNNTPSSELAEKVMRPLWIEIEHGVMEQLNTITIEDLCRRAHARGIESAANTKAHFDI